MAPNGTRTIAQNSGDLEIEVRKRGGTPSCWPSSQRVLHVEGSVKATPRPLERLRRPGIDFDT